MRKYLSLIFALLLLMPAHELAAYDGIPQKQVTKRKKRAQRKKLRKKKALIILSGRAVK